MSGIKTSSIKDSFGKHRTLYIVALHALVLAALFLVEEPFAQFYNNIFNDIHRNGEQNILEYTDETGDGARLQIYKNSRLKVSEIFNIDQKTKIQIRSIQKPEKTLQHSLFKILIDRRVFEFFEQFGVIFAAILVCLFLWEYDPDKRKYILWFITSIVAAYILVWLIQRTVGKIRPSRSDYVQTFLQFPSAWGENSKLSFPSGHTTFAFILATFLAGLYPRIHWLFYSCAVLTGLSRIAFEAHWLSDVYAGMLTGYGVTSFLRMQYGEVEKRFRCFLPGFIEKKFWPSIKPMFENDSTYPSFSAKTCTGKEIKSENLPHKTATLLFVPTLTSPPIIAQLKIVSDKLKKENMDSVVYIVTPDCRTIAERIRKKHNLLPDIIYKGRSIAKKFNLLSSGLLRVRETTITINDKGTIEWISNHLTLPRSESRGNAGL